MRKISRKYADPVDLIWLHAAAQMGMRIERSAEVNASWDGQGVLTIGTPETLDPDDCLAQMILHESCHSLCEGEQSLLKPDWGLESFNPYKKVREHACLRLQAMFADRYNMRSFYAATTVFRRYYDQLPADPLGDGDDPAIEIAREAWDRANRGPWAQPLDEALRRTALIADVLRDIADVASIWHGAVRLPTATQ
ncbi:MAG: hypothetical protein NT138_01745 [Planctomycetales bacterium]|nr:hypothetical protein [Planctomycetales bacterium]